MWVLESGEQARERVESMLQVFRSGNLKVKGLRLSYLSSRDRTAVQDWLQKSNG